MELKEITNKDEWENFLLQCAEKTFLQSWNWGEFQIKDGNKIWRFGIFSNGKFIGAALVIKFSAKRGTFLFVPHGPVVIGGLEAKDRKEILELILLQLSDIAKEEKASFIRFSPIFSRTEENEDIFSDLGFRQAPTHVHPEVTWELGIAAPEQELLSNMRKTTRYLIRQAEKNPDIQIVKSLDIKDLDLFKPVYAKTAKRHKFVAFPNKYLEKELGAFLQDNQIMIFLGKYKDKVVSAAIFVFWQDICFYHHSGSLAEFNKIPVSYLLQWEAIKEAKRRGCRIYNFWGIAPDVVTEEDASKSKHPWAGLSLFKMGFGGARKEYVKTQDFIISQKYWINYIIEVLRKSKRRL
ncbi:MAG: peptidoglycan bridge formation glycyltransferase FemA/FemB family protein [Candidatus Staskawiczbacteria bacterium]|jgi:lipid II:glycine glycyltransferase (peptidoglycan interpeptide bridge formation enzyme)